MKIRFVIYCFLFLFGTIFTILPQGKIILLNGTSCSGKSTTAKALEKELQNRGYRVNRISIDEFFLLAFKDGNAWNARYSTYAENSPFSQENYESWIYDLLNQEIAESAQYSEYDFTIVDYCVGSDLGFCNLLLRLKAFKVFFLKICCTYKKACERLVFRNSIEGDQKRAIHIVDLHFGIRDNFASLKNRKNFPTIHDHKIYDLEIDTTEKSTQECVTEIMSILDTEPHAFEQNFSDLYWVEKVKEFYSQETIKNLQQPIYVCCCW